MSAEIMALEPKELVVPNKPWLRRIGNYVIRFVRDSVEPADLRLLRSLDPNDYNGRLATGLQRTGDRLLAESEQLSALEIPFAAYDVCVCRVPEFDAKGQWRGHKLGLQITSEFIDGLNLTESSAGVRLNGLCAAMKEYVDQRTAERQPYLCDIFTPDQFLVSEKSGEAVLVDIDPIFAQPTLHNQLAAHDLINQFSALPV